MLGGADDIKQKRLEHYFDYLAQKASKEDSFASMVKNSELKNYLSRLARLDWDIRRDNNEIVSPVMNLSEALRYAGQIDKSLFFAKYPDGVVKSREKEGYRVILDLAKVEEKNDPTRTLTVLNCNP